MLLKQDGDEMGQVLIKIKVMPKGPESDVEKIKSDIEQMLKPKDIKIIDIGFGLKSLEVMFVRSPEDGDTDRIEKQLLQIDGVETAETQDVTLL
ncbi:MAG: elongation factor 1-beta [Candidatus Aenigmatarchaeota archaeon]|nr:MAG: elongation factor 1-beta [Candidatus Aenigmarchaeota archaeon]